MMMTVDQVEGTWRRVMRLDEDEWAELEQEAGPFQDELTAFAIAYTEHLSIDAMGDTMAGMIACYAVFREHFAVISMATEEQIRSQWTRSSARLKQVRALTDEGEVIGQLLLESPQPHLLDEVLSLVFAEDREPDDEDSPQPDEETQSWHMLAVLDTVITVLDSCARGTTRKS